jgi:hypothetical protein
MSILREQQEFIDEKVVAFHDHKDNCFQLWIQIWSIDGCTNYTQMLSSEHMIEFTCKWGNSYKFLQQGWEKLNLIISIYYFRGTKHGGKRHGHAVKSMLIQLA